MVRWSVRSGGSSSRGAAVSELEPVKRSWSPELSSLCLCAFKTFAPLSVRPCAAHHILWRSPMIREGGLIFRLWLHRPKARLCFFEFAWSRTLAPSFIRWSTPPWNPVDFYAQLLLHVRVSSNNSLIRAACAPTAPARLLSECLWVKQGSAGVSFVISLEDVSCFSPPRAASLRLTASAADNTRDPQALY